MRKYLPFLVLILLVGCSSGAEPTWDKGKFYEVGDYVFEYPAVAKVSDGKILYQGCEVQFGSEIVEGERCKEEGDVKLCANYDGEKVVVYEGQYGGAVSFKVSDERGVADSCVDFVDALTKKAGKTLNYSNQQLGFGFEMPDTFVADYVDNGVALRKRVEFEEGKFYNLEMGVIAYENSERYLDLASFVGREYAGYTLDFWADGIFVDDQSGEEASRHYFLMSGDAMTIYEAYVKAPRLRLVNHKGGFNEFVKTIDLF